MRGSGCGPMAAFPVATASPPLTSPLGSLTTAARMGWGGTFDWDAHAPQNPEGGIG